MPPVSEQISQILLKKLRHEELTRSELATLAEWENRSPEHKAFIEMMMDEALLSDKLKGVLEQDQQSAWKKIENALEAEWNERSPARRKPNWYKYTIAASMALVLGVAGYFLLIRNSSRDITPGQHRAMLTLSNGSVIDLANVAEGNVADDGGVRIVKETTGKLSYRSTAGQPASTPLNNMLATPRAGQFQLTLPDGTVAMLNAASSIRYPTVFAGDSRPVEVTGEVYFEVAKNADKPFIVNINSGKGEKRATVEVLGTHFNVMAYDDEGVIKTTLVEGKVKMADTETNTQLLLPGQQGQLSTNNKLSVSEVDAQNAVAWHDGLFSFKKADIQSIMRQIGRWYDVEIAYEGTVSGILYTGTIKRTEQISTVLEIFKYEGFKFRLEEGKITVLP